MKHTLLIVVLAMLSVHCSAQRVQYAFTYFTDTSGYTEIIDDSSLNHGNPWWNDIMNWRAALGFDFQFFGEHITNLYMSGGTGLADSTDTAVINPYAYNIMWPMNAYLYDRGMYYAYHFNVADTDSILYLYSKSPITYQTTGVSPNRITKVQYKNFGFMLDTVGDMYSNLQVWVYETSNVIEFRYGPSNVYAPYVFVDSTGPIVGLLNHALFNMGTDSNYNDLLNGPAANPAEYYFKSDTVTTPVPYIVASMPPNNMVYRFAPFIYVGDTSTDTVNHTLIPSLPSLQHLVTVAPNPVRDQLTICHDGIENGTVTLTDIRRKTIWQKALSEFGSVDVGALATGIYMVKVSVPGWADYCTSVLKR